VHGTFNYRGDHTFKFKTNPSLWRVFYFIFGEVGW
jgi:hypothetical protein